MIFSSKVKHLLTQFANKKVDWLNSYNQDIRRKVGLRLFDYPEVREFMIRKTEPFTYANKKKECRSNRSLFNSAPTTTNASKFTLIGLSVFFSLFYAFF